MLLRNLLSLYLPSLLMSFGQGMVFPVVPLLSDQFDVSPGLAAQVVTLLTLGRVVGLIPAGFIVDRFGRTQAMAVGAIIATLSAITAAYATIFIALLVAQFTWGMGYSLWQTGREVAAVETVRADQRGRVMSVLFGITAAGTSIGPALGGVLGDFFGLRTLFLVFGVMGLIVFTIAITLRVPPAPQIRTDQKFMLFGDIREIPSGYRVTFVVLIIATFMATLRMNAINSMMPIYMGSHLGYSATTIGFLFGIIGMVTMLMILPAGLISDKLGRKKATVPPALIAAGTFFFFPFIETFSLLVVLAIFMGISHGMALGSLTTYAYDIIPGSSRGRLQAMRRSIGEIGGVTAPLSGGVLAMAYHPGIAFIVFAPFQLLAGFLLARIAKETLVGKSPKVS